MRTTLNIDDELLAEVGRVTGLRTKTEMVEAGLQALLEKAAGQRLAALGGKVKDASAPYRRRPGKGGR